jgi:predicted nucleic-acid-binding Zn-ribbon protein
MSLKCPQCGEIEFIILPVVTLRVGNEIEIETNLRNEVSCKKCGFRAETKEDFEPVTVKVWIVGNSNSKRRQGINKISKTEDFDTVRAANNLQFKAYAQIKGGWIFTVDRWKKHVNGDTVALSERNYKTEEISII